MCLGKETRICDVILCVKLKLKYSHLVRTLLASIWCNILTTYVLAEWQQSAPGSARSTSDSALRLIRTEISEQWTQKKSVKCHGNVFWCLEYLPVWYSPKPCVATSLDSDLEVVEQLVRTAALRTTKSPCEQHNLVRWLNKLKQLETTAKHEYLAGLLWRSGMYDMILIFPPNDHPACHECWWATTNPVGAWSCPSSRR